MGTERIKAVIKLSTSIIVAVTILTGQANHNIDNIKLTNLGTGEIATWISETKNSSIDSAAVKEKAGTNLIIGDFTGQPGSVISYTEDRSPTLVTPINWTTASETVTMKLDSIHRIPIHVWIVNGDFKTMKTWAINANVRTSRIWSDERQGIAFSKYEIIDATGKTNVNGQSVSAEFASRPFNCDMASQIKSDVGFREGAVNVYYVEMVEVEGEALSTGGGYCGPPDNLVALGILSNEDLLVHELGHAFALQHIDNLVPTYFDSTNVMHPASDIRNFLTEGQTFRAVAHTGSAINLLYKTRSASAPKVLCGDDTQVTSPDCPPIQERIWPDGGENGTTWPSDQ